MIIVPGRGDLELPEFMAYNSPTPSALAWELPVALFQLRLEGTESVFDCSRDSGNLPERLRLLYPRVVYHRWNPLRREECVPSSGLPDGSFDRAICINTLERLPAPRRDELLAEIGRKLMPGGLLVLTSVPPFGAAALLECVEACRRNDLFPLDETAGGLALRDLAGAPQGRAAAIFFKTRRQLPCGKKVVLGLLCWNTRELTLASLRAHHAEARMLRRLGQNPFICVCDNGSSDGTAERLRAFAEDLDVPHRLILNPRNMGSTVGRNQIIDYMYDCDADYLLFADGDIEIVPFSSFAMLRHLENSDRRLACIGPFFDPPNQTRDRGEASSCLYNIERHFVEQSSWIAPTWYGLCRRAVFDDGVRFDDTPPFDGPGWGFEDIDLAFQMKAKGYTVELFSGMTHLHSAPQSSIRTMREQQIDPEEVYFRRKDYMLRKWKNAPPGCDIPLEILDKCTGACVRKEGA